METVPVAQLSPIDYAVMAVYFAAVLGVGWGLRRLMRTSTDFFLSGRSLPPWVTGLAFISANLGAQEVIGMGASGAKYGIATSHFYWVGAIPAMVFVGLFMMPFYYGSRARSVPEYLRLRFDEKTRTLNAVSFAVMTVFSSGISMYAMGKLLNLLLGWSFDVSVLVAAVIVLAYVLLGGLTSAIYNEVLQFFLIVFGFAPLVSLGLHAVGGWDGLTARLDGVASGRGLPAGRVHARLAHLGDASKNPIGVEWFGLVMGLGFVLSFGYWCTDFLVVQRAMAADSMTAARRTPLIAAVPKMLFPFLVILPGMIALVLGAGDGASAGQGLIPAKLAADGSAADRRGRPRGARLRPRHADDAGAALPVGHARPRAHGAARVVHVGDGGQRHRVQHRLDLRHLSEPHPARRVGRALPVDGPRGDGRRDPAVDRGGVRRGRVQQHHGPAAARVRVRERAAVRHLRARDVLEAHARGTARSAASWPARSARRCTTGSRWPRARGRG